MDDILATFNVRGTSFDGRQDTLRSCLRGRDRTMLNAVLVPEPTNPYDQNAIQVCILDRYSRVHHIGYIPRGMCELVTEAIRTKVLSDSHTAVVFRTRKKDSEFFWAELRLKRHPGGQEG